MNRAFCNEMPPDRLVDYADGELSPEEADRVAGHLETCGHCRELMVALGKSLEATQVIWRDAESQLLSAPMSPHRKGWRATLRRAALLAASVLLACGAIVGGHLFSRATLPVSPVAVEAPSLDEIARAANRAGRSARLLAAADVLARQEGGREYARQTYVHIVQEYPEQEAAARSRARLQSLSEGRNAL